MLTPRQQHCLRGIGITQWKLHSTTDTVVEELISETASTPPLSAEITPTQDVSQPTLQPHPGNLSNWEDALQAIQQCQQCELAKSCTRKVPGKGFKDADVLIIGEAPGHDEDLQGAPFVGRAGQLLDRMLDAIEISPHQVYITNILKCRPPQNRDPAAEEVAACSEFLKAQIQLIQPRIIFSVGRISAQNLLKVKTPVGKLRGQLHTLPETDIPLLVSYHPAYLLRNPAEKARVWQDLKSLRHLLKHG